VLLLVKKITLVVGPLTIDKILVVKLKFSYVISLLYYAEKDYILTTRIYGMF